MIVFLARDAQAKLALIVVQCLSIHLSICVSVRDSLSHAYVRSIARREPRRLPAYLSVFRACWSSVSYQSRSNNLNNCIISISYDV